MVARLYTADLLSEGKPVEKSVQKPKRTKKTKEVEEEIKTVEEPTPVEQVQDTPAEIAAVPVKEKKPRTEKQIAALERAKEARRLKKEQKDAEMAELKSKAEEVDRIKQEKEEAKRAKREAAKEKRKLAKLESGSVDMERQDKPKRQKAPKDENAPPAWFKSAISELKNEVAGDRTKKQLREEIKEEVAKKWKDPLVRGRLTDIQNSTAHKMYSAIFPGRRLG